MCSSWLEIEINSTYYIESVVAIMQPYGMETV